MSAHVFDHAVSDAGRAELAGWVTELRRQELLVANPLGPGRYHRNIAELPRVHPLLLEVRGALVERFGLGRYRSDPAYGDMVSFHEPGAFVHPHTDPFVEGERHVRMNVLVQHPDSGGVPVLDGRELEIRPGQGWFFRPYKVLHASTPVAGARARINLSFGWSVPPSYRLPGEAARGRTAVVEDLFAAIGRWDEAALRQLIAPDVIVTIPGASQFAGEHRGVDAAIGLWQRQRAFRAEHALELETVDVLDGREHAVFLTRSRAATGSWSTANVYGVRDGRIVAVAVLVQPLAAFDAFWSR